jgi:ERCC4-type nuclease
MPDLTIAVDTNEQKPHHYLEGKDVGSGTIVRYLPAKLDTFDYGVYGDWDEWEDHATKFVHFAIERKSVSDFISSWFGKTARNERAKITRARKEWGDKLPIIYVVEGGAKEIERYPYARWFPSGKVTAKVVRAKISDLQMSCVQVILCDDRESAEEKIVSLLKRRWRKVRFKQKTKGKQ